MSYPVLAEKDPDVSAEYGIDFHDEIVRQAARNERLSVADVVFYPSADPGWYFEVTTAGKTAKNIPPSIPRESGETLTDGSVELVCRHPSEVTIPTVSSAAWTLPTALTNVSQRTGATSAFVTVSGGVDGADYDLVCRMTPSVGNVLEQTITIPVRSQ